MSKLTKPRYGSLAFSPRKRARRQHFSPSYYSNTENRVLGFAGYKAGMTHIVAVDKKKNSPSFEQTVVIPVTILECPPLHVFSYRVYTKTPYGKKLVTEQWEDKPAKELKRKTKTLPKKVTDRSKKIESAKIGEVRLVVSTKPSFKKTPEVFELTVGGNAEEALKYAKEKLGKDISIDEVFKEGDMLDVIGVTKGKGMQGPVKRWGIRIQTRKAHGKRRHVGSIGSWSPDKTVWRVPMAGQMGYFRRTHFNKQILKLGDDGTEVTPRGGINNFGVVKGKYILVKGSIQGPKKRLVVMRNGIRPPKTEQTLPELKKVSRLSQQGRTSTEVKA